MSTLCLLYIIYYLNEYIVFSVQTFFTVYIMLYSDAREYIMNDIRIMLWNYVHV